MIIRVSTAGSVSLEDPDTFTAFHVAAEGQTIAGVVSSLAGDAVADGNEHVWIRIERLHALGAAHGGKDWRRGCDGMIEFARSKGWVDDEDRVRAHLELSS